MKIRNEKLRHFKNRFQPAEWVLVLFTLFYVTVSGITFILEGNYEFIFYIFIVLFFFFLVLLTLRRSPLTLTSLWLLSFWGLLHMAGGGVHVGGSVLYDLMIFPIYGHGELAFFRYDQFVHAYGFGTATFIVYQLLRPYLSDRANWKVLLPIIALAGMGLGAANEIIEFIATLTMANVHVGGYVNNALDLCFNTIGAVIAVVIIYWYKIRPHSDK